jgi:hypothetical protein
MMKPWTSPMLTAKQRVFWSFSVELRGKDAPNPLGPPENTLETSEEDWQRTSKRVGKIKNTLKTGGEDWKLHSKRVENKPPLLPRTQQSWHFWNSWASRNLYQVQWVNPDDFEPENTLETGGKDAKIHSKRVKKMWSFTRNACENYFRRLSNLAIVPDVYHH